MPRLRAFVASANLQLWVFVVGGGFLAASEALHPWARSEVSPRIFEAALEVDPKFALAHYNLGVLAQRDKRWQDALGHYRAAVRADPYDHLASLNLGEVADQLGHYEEARGALREAARAFGDDWHVHDELGSALLGLGLPKEAVTEFQEALRLDSAQNSIRLSLGVAYQAAGEVGHAEAAFREATRADPASAPAWFDLGLLYKRGGGRDSDAISCFEHAVAADSHYATAYSNLAELQIRIGRFADARRNLEALLRIEPGNVRARAVLEQIAGQTGSAEPLRLPPP